MQPDKNENQLIVWMPFVWPSGVVFANLANEHLISKQSNFSNRLQSFLGTKKEDYLFHFIDIYFGDKW